MGIRRHQLQSRSNFFIFAISNSWKIILYTDCCVRTVLGPSSAEMCEGVELVKVGLDTTHISYTGDNVYIL